ncbi:hypothetical protein QL285_090867 [Trifolium repens]|nr:hypothetical protein QL285_090867 [Trifolium repens]
MEPMDVNADLEVLDNKLSTLWNIFEKIGKDQSGVEKAICSYCCSEFSIGKNPISEYVSYFANESVSLSQSFYESSTLSKPSGVRNKTKKSKIAMDLQDFKTWRSDERSTPGKTELELYFEDTPMQLEEENSEDFEMLHICVLLRSLAFTQYRAYDYRSFVSLKFNEDECNIVDDCNIAATMTQLG